MKTRTRLILGILIVGCVLMIIVSTLATEPILRLVEPAPRRGPAEPFGFRIGLPFPGGMLGRFGPFGRHMGGWPGVASALGSFLFLYLFGVLAVLIFPRPMRVVRDAFDRGPRAWLRLLLIGALSALGFLLLTALGLVTSVAFPIPFLLAPILLVAAWAGLTGLSLWLGRAIRRGAGLTQASPVIDLALGSLVVFAFGRVPFAGWGIVILLAATALGAVVATRVGTGGRWSLSEFEETAM